MNILLKNLLLYLNSDKKRHMKNVLDGLDRLVELKEIDVDNLDVSELNIRNYTEEKDIDNLEELLVYYNSEEPSAELNQFLMKHYKKTPEPLEFLTSLYDKLINNVEDEKIIQVLQLLPDEKLFEYLSIQPRSYYSFYEEVKKIDKELDSIIFNRYRNNDENIDLEEKKKECELKIKKINNEKHIYKIQQQIYKFLLQRPEKLSFFAQYLTPDFFKINYANIDFNGSESEKINLEYYKMMDVENILPGFSRTPHLSGKPLYLMFAGEDLWYIKTYIGKDEFFNKEELKSIDNIAIESILSPSNYKNSHYRLSTLFEIDQWYLVPTNKNIDMVSFAIENLCNQSDFSYFEDIIEEIKHDEQLKQYIMQRKENIIVEMLKFSKYKISLYNSLVKILPDLQNKNPHENNLLDDISSLCRMNKGVFSKKIKVIEKVPDLLLFGNTPETLINFFIKEKWNDYENTSKETNLLTEILVDRIKKYNDKWGIVEKNLFENLYNWEKLMNKTSLYKIHYADQNKMAQAIKDTFKESGLSPEILTRFPTVREMMRDDTKKQIIQITFEKMKLEEMLSIAPEQNSEPNKRKRM